MRYDMNVTANYSSTLQKGLTHMQAQVKQALRTLMKRRGAELLEGIYHTKILKLLLLLPQVIQLRAPVSGRA